MDTILTLKEYSEHIGVPEKDIIGDSRKYEHKIPRHLYWLYLFQNGFTKRSIARKFNMNHSTIINGLRTVSNLIETEDKILSEYEGFIDTFLHLPQSN